MAVFDDFCNEKSVVIHLKTCRVEEFKGVLCQFYRRLRTKSDDFNKKSSYLEKELRGIAEILDNSVSGPDRDEKPPVEPP